MVILAKGDTYLMWRSLTDTNFWLLKDRNVFGLLMAIAKYIFSLKCEKEDRYNYFQVCLLGFFFVRSKK